MTWSAIWRQLGRPISTRCPVRRSTLLMVVAFLVLGNLYLEVRTPSVTSLPATNGIAPVTTTTSVSPDTTDTTSSTTSVTGPTTVPAAEPGSTSTTTTTTATARASTTSTTVPGAATNPSLDPTTSTVDPG